MAVSANTLFHFTNSKSLKGILSLQGFYPQYSDEHFENILPVNSIYRITFIPLISFCDLTIMQISGDSLHREHYGEYGIGLTKPWGIKHRVSPVNYVHKNSQSAIQLYEFIKFFRKYSKEQDASISIKGIRQQLVDSFKYIKPYQGRWQKGNQIDKDKPDITYYNEREWRFCPPMDAYKVLSGVRVDNKTQKEKYNQTLKTNLLKFEPDDVKYILIKDKKEIADFVHDVIEKMKITRNQKNELTTKIITFEEIKEDF